MTAAAFWGRPIARKIHIVQIRRSLSTQFASDTLTIRWSALEVVRSRSDKVPSGLDMNVGPYPAAYKLRGDRLAATIGGATDVFARPK